MKLKKLLSFALALAMVLAFIPALSLTASAAEETVLYDLSTQSVSGETGISSGTYGWSAVESFTNSNGVFLLSNGNGEGFSSSGEWSSSSFAPSLTFFPTVIGRNQESENETAIRGDRTAEVSLDNCDDSADADVITISFIFAAQAPADLYQEWLYKDIDGKTIARIWFDKNASSAGAMTFGTTQDIVCSTQAGMLALRGQTITITAEKNSLGTYTVTYAVNGEVWTTETVDTVNGFGSIYSRMGDYNTQYAAAGMVDLAISYKKYTTPTYVTATYMLGDDELETIEHSYDANDEVGAVFAEKYYSENGSNVMYGVGETTHYDGDGCGSAHIIDLEVVDNPAVNDDYYNGASVKINGTAYIIKSDNLIPNGDFSHYVDGWYAADGSAAVSSNFKANGDGTATIVTNANSSSAYSLQRSWALGSGIYLFTYYQDCSTRDAGWQRLSRNNDFSNNTSDSSAMLIGSEVSVYPSVGTNTVVFDNTDGYAYLNYRAGYSGGVTVGNFGLYEIDVDTSVKTYTVSYVDEEDGTVLYEDSTEVAEGTVIEERTFYANGKIYTAPETTITSSDPIPAKVSQAYAAQKDIYWYKSNIYGGTAGDHLFVAAYSTVNGETRAYETDADGNSVFGNAPAPMGNIRFTVVQYELPVYKESKMYTLVMPVNNFTGCNLNDGMTVRFAAYKLADGTEFEDQDSAISADSSDFASTGEPIYSDWADNTATEIVFNITDAVKNAKGDTITLKILAPRAGVHLNNLEITGIGGDKEGLASYIAVTDDGVSLSVDEDDTTISYITVNGSKMSDTTATVASGSYAYAYDANGNQVKVYVNGDKTTTYTQVTDITADTVLLAVPTYTVTVDATSTTYYEGDTVTLPTDYAYYVDANNVVYNGGDVITVTSDMELTGNTLGVNLVDGAQIRIGKGIGENESDDDTYQRLLGDSGLRFIATITSENSLAQHIIDGDIDGKVGIAISADDEFSAAEDQLVYVTDADGKWQLDNKVFSVAVTGIATTNYNTTYYAIPVVMIGDTYYTGKVVGRTPYQVAAGILLSEDTTTKDSDGETYSQSAGDTTLYKVLNAYANATGARLTLSGTQGSYLVEVEDAYTNSNAFFTVDATDNDDGTITIKLTGKTSSVQFYNYWAEYIKINNNHTTVAENVYAGEISDDGNTLTFTFTVPAAE